MEKDNDIVYDNDYYTDIDTCQETLKNLNDMNDERDINKYNT